MLVEIILLHPLVRCVMQSISLCWSCQGKVAGLDRGGNSRRQPTYVIVTVCLLMQMKPIVFTHLTEKSHTLDQRVCAPHLHFEYVHVLVFNDQHASTPYAINHTYIAE
jgi:hypothetical protein